MRTISNLLRIETQVKSEWPSGLWKIQLVLGIRSSIPLIQAVLKNVSADLTLIRNRSLDRQRVAQKLSSTRVPDDVNRKRKDTVKFNLGDFVLMHRDSQMHISKSDYEFLK